MLVSIITPAYNSGEFISLTIESVLSQSYKNWEMIIINDGSTDQTADIVHSYALNESRIKVFDFEKSVGPGPSRNLAIQKSNGDYIAFLDSDDLWESNKLERQMAFMVKNNYLFTFTSYRKINKSGKIISKPLTIPSSLSYFELLWTCPIGCLTVMIESKLAKTISIPLIKRASDYAYWLKITKNGIVGYGLNECLSNYRIRFNSISSNKLKKAFYQWKIYRKLEGLSFRESIKYFLIYAINGFKKYKY